MVKLVISGLDLYHWHFNEATSMCIFSLMLTINFDSFVFGRHTMILLEGKEMTCTQLLL